MHDTGMTARYLGKLMPEGILGHTLGVVFPISSRFSLILYRNSDQEIREPFGSALLQ